MTIVTWKWNDSNYLKFTSEHVNILHSMLKRNTTVPFRVLCITDDPKGVDCETYPLWDELRNVKNDHWKGKKPQCYVRLKAFSEWFREVAGDRFLSIDLDCVILGNIDYILNRKEDFIINKGTTGQNEYNGAMWMMNTGCRSHVYERFNSKLTRQASAMYLGSDQAWIRWILGKNQPTFSDGIYNFQLIKKGLPQDAKIVFFHGREKPWHAIKRHEWIKNAYY